MSDAMEWALGQARDAVLAVIRTINNESSLDDIKRASRVTIDLRKRAEAIGRDLEPGEALEWLQTTLYMLPEWHAFIAARKAVWSREPSVKARRARDSKRWYEAKGSAERKTPEVRARLAAQARARRAAKRDAKLQEVS